MTRLTAAAKRKVKDVNIDKDLKDSSEPGNMTKKLDDSIEVLRRELAGPRDNKGKGEKGAAKGSESRIKTLQEVNQKLRRDIDNLQQQPKIWMANERTLKDKSRRADQKIKDLEAQLKNLAGAKNYAKSTDSTFISEEGHQRRQDILYRAKAALKAADEDKAKDEERARKWPHIFGNPTGGQA